MNRFIILSFSSFLISFLLSVDVWGQNQIADSLIDDNDILTLNKRISIGLAAGKRTNELSVNLSFQFSTYISWKKFDLGLGVNYENEEYFNLIPAYVHFSYNLVDNRNPTKLVVQSGLSFNTPIGSRYDYGKPGVMISSGIEQHFKLFKIVPANFQILYRFQQTTTIEEWTSRQQQTSSDEIKFTMSRIMLVLGVNF